MNYHLDHSTRYAIIYYRGARTLKPKIALYVCLLIVTFQPATSHDI